jgi:hypothetical protein
MSRSFFLYIVSKEGKVLINISRSSPPSTTGSWKGGSPDPPPTEAEREKTGKAHKGKGRAPSLERLRNLKDDVLRFFTDLRVTFSNNVAERSFHMSKFKMKTAGSFRSADGGSNFCWIFSIIDTVRKNGGNPFKALEQLFNNSFSLAFLD